MHWGKGCTGQKNLRTIVVLILPSVTKHYNSKNVLNKRRKKMKLTSLNCQYFKENFWKSFTMVIHFIWEKYNRTFTAVLLWKWFTKEVLSEWFLTPVILKCLQLPILYHIYFSYVKLVEAFVMFFFYPGSETNAGKDATPSVP